jgi:hypothetical protein
MSLKNPVTPPGIDPGTVRLVAQPLNHYVTPGPMEKRDGTTYPLDNDYCGRLRGLIQNGLASNQFTSHFYINLGQYTQPLLYAPVVFLKKKWAQIKKA